MCRFWSPRHCPSHPLYFFFHKLLQNLHHAPCLPTPTPHLHPHPTPVFVAGGRDTALQVLMRRPPCPCSASGQAEGHMPNRPEETPGMGKAALANAFTRLWHNTALPGCRASSLHQHTANIPFLQELPWAPRKGEKQMGAPCQGHCSPWRTLPKVHGTLMRGWRRDRGAQAPRSFLHLRLVLKQSRA